jgi:hypothetical protein
VKLGLAIREIDRFFYFFVGTVPKKSWLARMLIKLPFQIFAGYVASCILCIEIMSEFSPQFPNAWGEAAVFTPFGVKFLIVSTLVISSIFYGLFTPFPKREVRLRAKAKEWEQRIENKRLLIENEKARELKRIQELEDKRALAESQKIELEKEKQRKAANRARAAKRKGMQGLVKTSRCRIPKDSDDFENVCAEWMAKNGFPDAKRTPKGPDGGVDVVSSSAVAQSKFHPSQKVGAPDVQALVGSRVQLNKKRALFFNYGLGYTDQAIIAARQTKVLLYRLNVDKRSFELVE